MIVDAIAGMADVVSPDCRLCDTGLIDYIIGQLDRSRNRGSTLFLGLYRDNVKENGNYYNGFRV